MIRVLIRRESTDESREYSYRRSGSGLGFPWFLWTEGNYSCDCNRARLVFGEEGHPCGETEFTLLGIEEVEDGK